VAVPKVNRRNRCTQKELSGRIERVADRLFEGEEAVLHVIERIVVPLGFRVDATSPWVDARLPDRSRV
jgi:pilus assembly protein CpaF